MRIILPNIRGSIFAGFVLALVSGWDEAVITLFVTGRAVQVLPRKIWDSLRYDIDPIVAVVATIMLALTFGGVLIFVLLSKRYPPARDNAT
jgi:putative spermidine/putrescine transport system permease protein